MCKFLRRKSNMKCKKCGYENDQGVDYCANCGNKFEKENNNAKKKKKIGKRKRLFFVPLVFAVMLAIVFFLSVFKVADIPIVTDFMYRIGWIHPDTVEANPKTDNYIPESNSIKFDQDNNVYFADNEIIIIFKSGTDDEQINRLINEIEGTQVGTVPSIDLYQIRLKHKYSLAELKSLGDDLTEKYDFIQLATYDSAVIGAENEVEAIAPNDKWKKDVDETDWKDTDVDGTNWWLEAVEAPKAWSYNDQMAEINIGISDSSFDVIHEDLKNKCSFPNKLLESRNDSTLWWLDNDKNTDYSDKQVNAHGTHVAGIIGAEHDNEKGISGISKKCYLKLAPQYVNEGANDFLWWDSSIYANLSYLVDAGCKVINYSQGKANWTEAGYSDDFIRREGNLAAISITKLIESGKNDFIVVQSAGNGNNNGVALDAINNGWFCSVTDSSVTGSQQIKASEIREHIIIVGAAKQNDNSYVISDYSNYGDQVNIFAPGDDIYSTLPGDIFYDFEFFGSYGEKSGTSMAAPIVSGVCGLTWSANPSLSAKQVKNIVCSTKNTNISVESNPQNPNFKTSRMINALLSVEAALNLKKNGNDSSADNTENSYVSGKYLVDVDGKLICAKSNAIYYKESINSEEKKIAYAGNVSSLLSDGETLYYVEGFDNSNDNFDKQFTPKKIYKAKVSGSKSDYILTSKGQADLITYQDGCIYYLDTTKQGDSYKYSLMKYDTDSDSATSLTDEWSGNIPVYWKQNAYAFDNTIFFTKNNSLYSYDIATNKTEMIVSSSEGEICDIIDGKVCFEYTKDNSNFVAMVDDGKNVETSVAVDAKYDLQAVTNDGKYGLYFTRGFDDFDLFTIDLKTGESIVSEGDAGSCKGKNYFITKDLEHPENIYFMYNLKLYDENKKSAEFKKHDDFEINITKPMWIIDGYVVDWELNTYKIYDETIDYSNSAQSSVQSSNTENNSEWQNLYIDYVDSLNEAYEDILIVNIDDDDIPELYILGKYHMAGAVLCWIDNGEVKFKPCGQNFGYSEKSGKCYAYTMQMGVSLLTEYTLTNGNLTEKKIASCSENDNPYTWNEETVSQKEFWDKYKAYVNKYTTPDTSEYIKREAFDTVIKSY